MMPEQWKWLLIPAVLGALVCGAGRTHSLAQDASVNSDLPASADLLTQTSSDGREHPIQTVDEWQSRRHEILQGMQLVMGDLPSRTELPAFDLTVREEEVHPSYRRQLIEFTPEAGDRLPALLYLPQLAPNEKRPAILALHPTGTLGKRIVAGESERANREYATELAERGYVVLAPDYPSFGDYAYDFDADDYVSGTMKGIFNHMRCVDLLASLPYVDAARIGVIGHSLGGHNAMFVAAFDPRIKAIVSSCGWTPFHDYYGGKLAGWTSPRYMPRIREMYELDPDQVPFDFYGIVAALAPRPFFSNSPLHDSNFDVAGIRKAIPVAKEVYALYGHPENLQVRYPDCEHDFPPEIRSEAYQFLDAALGWTPQNGSSATSENK